MKKGVRRFTVDLEPSVYEVLEKLSERLGTSRVKLISKGIETFTDIDEDTRSVYYQAALSKMRSLQKERETAGGFEREKIDERLKKHQAIAFFFSPGSLSEEKTMAGEQDGMTYRKLKDGIVTFPDDWVIVEDAVKPLSECRNAAVVEVKNAPGCPHFLFGIDTLEDTRDEEKIFEACAKTFPAFQKILDSRVHLDYSYDKDGTAIATNYDEYICSPQPGIFQIYEEGSLDRLGGYVPPYGAMVIHDSKEKSS